MFRISENEKEFRFGDSGPKYLLKGPRMNFGILRLNPGQIFGQHYHNVMEENFYVIEGCVEFTVNEEKFTAKSGTLVHCEPGEAHGLRNPGEKPAIVHFMMAPYQEDDKFEIN